MPATDQASGRDRAARRPGGIDIPAAAPGRSAGTCRMGTYTGAYEASLPD